MRMRNRRKAIERRENQFVPGWARTTRRKFRKIMNQMVADYMAAGGKP